MPGTAILHASVLAAPLLPAGAPALVVGALTALDVAVCVWSPTPPQVWWDGVVRTEPGWASLPGQLRGGLEGLTTRGHVAIIAHHGREPGLPAHWAWVQVELDADERTITQATLGALNPLVGEQLF